MALTIDDVKNQLRLDADTNSEDGHLTLLLKASQSACSNYCNRVIYWSGDRPADESLVPDGAIDASEDLEVGVLMLVAHLYENREVVVIGNIVNQVPMTVDLLWAPYRLFNLGVG